MPREMKSHQDIHDYIVAIESDFPVDTWSVNGIHVWPYIRIKIYYTLIHFVEGTYNLKAYKKHQKKNAGFFKRLKTKFFELFYYLNSIQRQTCQQVMFATLSLYRVGYEGLFFHKFFDAMIKAHHLEGKTTIIEIQGIRANSYNRTGLIDGISLRNGHKILNRLTRWLPQYKTSSIECNLPLYDSFFERILEDSCIGTNLDLEKDSLVKWANKIKATSIVYKKLFKKRRTQRFVTISYYGFDDMAAALFAANSLGVETVDFQHGPQTNVHMAYSSWTRMPKNGFNTMPKVYWNWDQKSKEHLSSWWKLMDGSKIIGHPWLAITQSENQFYKNCDFLYTLQLINESNVKYFFPEQILKLMRRDGVSWILRIHPRNGTGINLIQEFLKKNNVPQEHYSIENPSTIPLATSLKSCGMHITNYSGCLIEASILKKQTIIIDQTGYLFFKNYIDNELVYFLDKHKDNFSDRVIEIYTSRKTGKKNIELEIFNPFTGL